MYYSFVFDLDYATADWAENYWGIGFPNTMRPATAGGSDLRLTSVSYIASRSLLVVCCASHISRSSFSCLVSHTASLSPAECSGTPESRGATRAGWKRIRRRPGIAISVRGDENKLKQPFAGAD